MPETSRTPISRRALGALAVLLLVAVPATALVLRPTIYFLAKFDDPVPPPEAPSTVAADIGFFSQDGPASVFSVQPGPDGDGVLRVEDPTGNLASDGVLYAEFEDTATGDEIEIEASVVPGQTLGPDLIFRAEDESGTGVIDVEWDGDDGVVRVDGDPTGVAFESGLEYDMRLELRAPLIGVANYTLSLTWEEARGGTASVVKKGLLLMDTPSLKLERLAIVKSRESGAGFFLVDDVSVVGLEQVSMKSLELSGPEALPATSGN